MKKKRKKICWHANKQALTQSKGLSHCDALQRQKWIQAVGDLMGVKGDVILVSKITKMLPLVHLTSLHPPVESAEAEGSA